MGSRSLSVISKRSKSWPTRLRLHVPASAVVEKLEKRRLMSAASVRGVLHKLDDQLVTDYRGAAGNGTAAKVSVEAFANAGQAIALAGGIAHLGGTDLSIHSTEVDATFPAENLNRLSILKSLRFARSDQTELDTGSVTSQGDTALATAAARAVYGVTGSGVKVGIISDSFNNDPNTTDKYSTDITTGDLPSGVQILAEDPTAGTDEGRAIAQVIYDSAPGVTFAFATGESTQATMAANITALVKAGAKVIVDDISYLAEPFFADGVIAQAVASAVASGVTYVTAAGNNGSDAYASNWNVGNVRSANSIASAAGAPQFYGGTTFNFNPTGAVNDLNSFTLAAGKSIALSLQWDSPYYSVSGGSGSQNQVDGYILNADGTQILAGGVNLDIGGDPIQTFTYTNNTSSTNTYNLMVVNESGSAPGYIKYIEFDGQASSWEFGYNAGSVYGHANTAAALTVGSAYYASTPGYGVSPAVVENNSSTGGTPILFSTTGARLSTAVNRQEPDVVGVDGVYTTFFGQSGSSFPQFYGTSAAAAGVAAAAALLLQANPSLTPAQVDAALENTALAIGSPVPNSQAGYGLIQASSAVSTVVSNISGTVFQDNNGNATLDSGETGVAGVRVYVDTKNTGSYATTDISTVTGANGTFTLANVPDGTAIVRLVAPGGFVAVNSVRTVNASGGTSGVPGVNFGVFPTSFTSNAGNASYMLQADSRNSSNVDIYVGSVLTYTVARSLLPALAFTLGGTGNMLTVNFANGTPAPSGGVSFSNTGNASGNSIVFNGTSGNDTASINSQTTVFDSSSFFTSNIQSETLNGNNGNDSYTVVNAQPAGQGLTFNGGTGNTSLVIKSALPNNGAGVVFNAGTTTTDQNTLTVNSGTYTFNADPAGTSANLTLNTNANVVFAAGGLGSGINTRTLAAMNLGASALVTVATPASHADRAVLVAKTITIASGGKLDLTGNDAIFSNSSIGAISALLANGSNGGLWNGAGGIISSTAATDATHLTALGSLLNSATGGGAIYSATSTMGLFDGQSPAAGSVLVKYTYFGDANLSGAVDGSDYTLVDNGYNNALTGWGNGDFNYDSVINGSDYTLMDNVFNTQGNSLG